MSESKAAKVQRLSEEAVHRAVGQERRDFTITKFGRHEEDGYFHARVTPAGGKAVYVHRRFGSWMAPGTEKGRAVMKEIAKEVAVELQRRARQIEKDEARAREAETERQDSNAAERAAGEGQAPDASDSETPPEHLREG